MWNTLGKAVVPLIRKTVFLSPEAISHEQIRTTYILKRRIPPLLHKNGAVPKRLRNRQYIYDLVENTDAQKKPDIEVILTSYVAGLGDVGSVVKVRPNYGYNNLLLTGTAVYASPENLNKYKDYASTKVEKTYSSATAQRVLNSLSRMTLSVIMNRENPWTLQPWHIRTSFRKCGYHVPDDAIALPPKPITGPNMEFENKEFYITITVNNTEKVNVRCRIHHWSTEVVDRLQHKHEFWKIPSEAIFAEDGPILNSLPSNPANQNPQEVI